MFFDTERIKKRFGNQRAFEYYNEISSTNEALVKRVRESMAKGGDVIAAGCQSAGRGRRGKSFSSPEGGIYFSFAANNTGGAIPTVVCGAAVAKALEYFGFSPEIKWVNDILLGGKKVCGILAEAVSGTDLCVIGIGINLNAQSIPADLSGIAAALDMFGALPAADELVYRIVSEYEMLEKMAVGDVIEEYKRRLKMLGREVILKMSGDVCVAEDVNESGELTVRMKNGERRVLNSGEISIKLTT